MQSDSEEIKKHVRTYWMIGAALYVFTIITVAVNQVHLAVPLAITVALIVAATKGSMVAAVFMHLNHEKQWIYGSLILTVIFFFVLMFVPVLTTNNNIGRPLHHASTGAFAGPNHIERGAAAETKEH
jgi:caa(3)-type oxidase subunit IV